MLLPALKSEDEENDTPGQAHLVQKRRDGIVRTVQEQQQRRDVRAPEVEKLVLLCDDLLKSEEEEASF